MARAHYRDEYLESFRAWLQDAGFRREADTALELWAGTVSVEWEAPDTGNRLSASHKVAIVLPPEFPYRAPLILSKDDPPLAPSWHLMPGSPQTLCLWNSDNGWQPHYTAQWLLRRIEEWFRHFHTDSWPPDSGVPDLHRYLDQAGVAIIGNEWTPPTDQNTGRFVFWKHKTYPDIFPCLASYCENKGVLFTAAKPESRLADNLSFSDETYRKHVGVWFRLARPLVPPDNLGDLLRAIDQNMKMESGWAASACVNVFGHQVSTGTLPFALGYTDYRQEERWLFLIPQLPAVEKKRYSINWINGRALGAIKLKSLQTAPARNEDLLRRSAFISRQLNTHRVTIFGVGAVGGSVALLLAKTGIGQIRLVDHDVLMPGNVMRHVCGLSRTGILKTVAVKNAIHQHNPDCQVECLEETWKEETIKTYVDGCDMVIDATANRGFSLYLNELCITWEQPVLFVATYRRASVGRITVRRNSDDPCMACYAQAAAFWPTDQYPVIPVDPKEMFIEDGCGSVTEEAVALDVEAVANAAARAVIAIIRGELGEKNLGILVNRPLEGEKGLLAQEGLHWIANQALSHCAVCRR